MPEVKPKESEADFVTRCMGDSAMNSEFPDAKQRAAVCYSKYTQHHKEKEKKKDDKKKDTIVSLNKSFEVFTPVSKCWEEEVTTKDFKGKEVTKNQKYFEVTVSGLKEDRDGEVMDQLAVDDMISQFKSGTIGFFPDHGKDATTGERTYSWKQIMGVWVDAKQEGDKLKAVCRLNTSHPDAGLFWSYMNEGIPLGFSIGGRPIEVVED